VRGHGSFFFCFSFWGLADIPPPKPSSPSPLDVATSSGGRCLSRQPLVDAPFSLALPLFFFLGNGEQCPPLLPWQLFVFCSALFVDSAAVFFSGLPPFFPFFGPEPQRFLLLFLQTRPRIATTKRPSAFVRFFAIFFVPPFHAVCFSLHPQLVVDSVTPNFGRKVLSWLFWPLARTVTSRPKTLPSFLGTEHSPSSPFDCY